MIKIKNLSKNERTSLLISDLFTQGDSRYSRAYVDDVIYFLKNKAIIIETKDISSIKNRKDEDLKIRGPQQPQKSLTLSIFKEFGVKFIGFEISVSGGRVDVLGEKEGKKIYVECGPCRVDKGFNYLREDNVELWLVDCWLEFNPEKTNKRFHIVKRGPNWQETVKKYNNFIYQKLKKVKNPLDSL